MNKPNLILLIIFLLEIVNGCVVQYFPGTNEVNQLLVVDGLITDQPGVNTINLSKSHSLWKNQMSIPVSRAIVTISDDLGHTFDLKEVKSGSYSTDSATFRGMIGRSYTLNIKTTTDSVNYSYTSTPALLKAVPRIDSIYYEKRVFNNQYRLVTGCQIFLDTHDPTNNCKFFRWNYSETWEFHLPSIITNRICWLSDKSKSVSIKNASILEESSVTRFPINTITDPNDRLSVKYSLLVNQYSLNEEEYTYWERFKNISEQVGGLYDQIPSIIPNNLFCVEDPSQPVLGYFSVSAISSKRIFIKDNFDWLYTDCVIDSIPGAGPVQIFDVPFFVVQDHTNQVPPYRLITYKGSCTDCRKRGTDIKPVFWDDDK